MRAVMRGRRASGSASAIADPLGPMRRIGVSI
jgi:hypothetical protein